MLTSDFFKFFKSMALFWVFFLTEHHVKVAKVFTFTKALLVSERHVLLRHTYTLGLIGDGLVLFPFKIYTYG